MPICIVLYITHGMVKNYKQDASLLCIQIAQQIFSESVRPCQNGSGGKNKLRNMILEICCI